MAALVCDICGGKLIMGSGGIAVCDSCGVEHSQDRMREKIQEIKGVVQVDNSHMVDNWMKMGTAATQAGNNKEAYDYFTKVIEVDPQNWRAIFEKGKAGAWQSTLANLRTPEIYQGVNMALDIIKDLNMSEDELVHIKNEFAVALFNINNAITDLMEQNLLNLDDKYFDAHWDQMWNTRQRYLTNVDQLEDALSLIIDFDDDLSKSNVIEFKKRMCSDLRNACSSTQYWTDYSQTTLGYLGFEPNQKKQYLDKYWELVDEIREVESEYATDEWSYPDPFGPGLHFSNEFSNYWKKIEEEKKIRRERELAQKRYNDYWAEHAEEKKNYNDRIIEITYEISEIKKSLLPFENDIKGLEAEKCSKVPAEVDVANIQRNINSLTEQKNSLGLFQGKAKKDLQEQIDNLMVDLQNAENNVRSQKDAQQRSVNEKIAAIKADIKPQLDKIIALESERTSITAELNKAR